MEGFFTVLKWIGYALAGVIALLVLGLVVELIHKVWHQVILGEVRIDENDRDVCDVANEILGRKEKVEIGAWLKGAEYETAAREVKRRYQLKGRAASRQQAD